MTEELDVTHHLPDLQTGELLPAIPTNAARVLDQVREQEHRLAAVKRECVEVLLAESKRQGTKTLRLDGHTIVLTGGVTTDYDPHELMAGLMEAGCPPDRINDAVTEIVSYKVNRAVLRQLAAANETYADAIDHAETTREAPWRATVRK